MKIIGKVTEEEKNEIQQLFERKNGLLELAKILTKDNSDLYEKVVQDLGETSTRYQQWWDTKSLKYQWERTPNGHWEINFDTCEVILLDIE